MFSPQNRLWLHQILRTSIILFPLDFNRNFLLQVKTFNEIQQRNSFIQCPRISRHSSLITTYIYVIKKNLCNNRLVWLIIDPETLAQNLLNCKNLITELGVVCGWGNCHEYKVRDMMAVVLRSNVRIPPRLLCQRRLLITLEYYQNFCEVN